MVVAPSDAGEPGESGVSPTTTLAGWRQFVDAPPATFELLPDGHGRPWPPEQGSLRRGTDQLPLRDWSSWRRPRSARSPGRAGC